MTKRREPKHVKVPPVVFLIILVFGAFGMVQLVRAATGGISGSPGTRYDSTQSTNYVSTESYTYASIPNMSIPFTTSNQAPAIVTVSFSPNAIRNLNCAHIMRATIDGVSMSPEVPVVLADIDSKSFTFVTDSLAPGSHTAIVEWKVAAGFSALGCTEVRSLVVLHQ